MNRNEVKDMNRPDIDAHFIKHRKRLLQEIIPGLDLETCKISDEQILNMNIDLMFSAITDREKIKDILMLDFSRNIKILLLCSTLARSFVKRVSKIENWLGFSLPYESELQHLWIADAWENTYITTDKKRLEIIFLGDWNRKGERGADFFNAEISLNGEIITGDIEMHRKTSDWFIHDHHFGDQPVILHVVFQNDLKLSFVPRFDGYRISQIELPIPKTNQLQSIDKKFRRFVYESFVLGAFLSEFWVL